MSNTTGKGLMSSAEIPDDPTDHRVDPTETRHERLVDAAVEAEMATGDREETEEAAKRSLVKRVAIIVAGSLVTLLGIFLLVLPGPGMIVVFGGLLLLATEIPFAARLLEKVKKRIPQDENGKIPRRSIVYIVAVGVVTVGASTAASIWWSFLRT
jgi:uncharacterized protein (TIGR02611 family)